MIDKSDLITVLEAAKLLGCSPEHTQILLRNRELQGTKVGPVWMIIRRSILERSQRLQQVPANTLEESEIFLRPSSES